MTTTFADPHSPNPSLDPATPADSNQSSSRGPFEGTVDEVKAEMSRAASTLKQRASEAASERKQSAARAMRAIANSLRDSNRTLADDEVELGRRQLEKAADSIDSFADRLENKQIEDVVDDVERFARHRPEIFLGVALLAGFVVGRFLRSSTSGDENGSWESYASSKSPGTAYASRGKPA